MQSANGNAAPQQNHDIPSDNINWENCPEKRKWTVASYIVCLLTAAGIITYAALIETTVVDYQADNDNSTIKLARVKTCYTRNEKTTYPVFFNLGLGLIGIVLGTIVDRFCMFFEELFQLKSRYDGKPCKAFRACFSGISWPAVFLVTALIVISSYVGRKTPYKMVDLIYIIGGIGVGPLVIHLLNLNTESEVHVSRILEEREMYPGYTLAWSYYFNHLKPAVERLDNALNSPVDQPTTSSTPNQNEIKLSLNKLLLLLPPSTDLAYTDKLIDCDNTIRKLRREENPYPFPVYQLKVRENEYGYYAMKCVKEPIIALREMLRSSDVNFVTRETYKYEVKRFYGTLCEILKNTQLDGYTQKGLVIPIPVKPGDHERLMQGGLTMYIVRKLETLSNHPPPSSDNEREDETARLIAPSHREGPIDLDSHS